MPGNMKELELRLEKIESLLTATASSKTKLENLSEDELKAYKKVRDVIAADWGEFCGINDCFRCIIVRCIVQCISCDIVCTPCDFECSCGPCGYGGMQGRVGRFRNLG